MAPKGRPSDEPYADRVICPSGEFILIIAWSRNLERVQCYPEAHCRRTSDKKAEENEREKLKLNVELSSKKLNRLKQTEGILCSKNASL